jgi:hypothetical protein
MTGGIHKTRMLLGAGQMPMSTTLAGQPTAGLAVRAIRHRDDGR